MKLIRWLPPVVALVVVGIWIGIQRLSVSVMENENSMLQKHIASVRSLGPRTASPHTQAGAPEKLVQANGAIDWKEFAAQLAEVQRSEGVGDLRTKVHLQQRMQAMSQQAYTSTPAPMHQPVIKPRSGASECWSKASFRMGSRLPANGSPMPTSLPRNWLTSPTA